MKTRPFVLYSESNMPLKTPFSSSKKSKGGPRSKGASSSGKASSKRGKASPHSQRAADPPSWWASLSDERKLDVVGAVMAVIGILISLILFSPQRSEPLGEAVSILSRLFGWGLYVLTFGLIGMGIWLILRRIEKLPPLTLERGTGIIVLFLWLLAAMHFVIAAPSLADQAAMDGAGGGYIGAMFEKFMFNYFGMGGSVVLLVAWLFIAVTMTFDIEIQDMFHWAPPLWARVRAEFARRLAQLRRTPPELSEVASNGYTPLNRPEPVVDEAPLPEVPVTTVRPPSPVIQWQLPDVKNILESGSAPEVNEEFIEQRARLIEETLASFGAPAQVVEINRGPTVTQFGVEPLFVETRSGKMRVRVSKIVSLSDDLALALAAPRIRIQAPVPGHSYLGIEVPNEEMTVVALRDLVESEAFPPQPQTLSFALGQDVSGHPIGADLTVMPHLLIAGTTGSGKSVCVNSILSCMLLTTPPTTCA
jgi:DNA segregation ATPase FtsK/SpoIIIE, S-DNA-T family